MRDLTGPLTGSLTGPLTGPLWFLQSLFSDWFCSRQPGQTLTGLGPPWTMWVTDVSVLGGRLPVVLPAGLSQWEALGRRLTLGPESDGRP